MDHRTTTGTQVLCVEGTDDYTIAPELETITDEITPIAERTAAQADQYLPEIDCVVCRQNLPETTGLAFIEELPDSVGSFLIPRTGSNSLLASALDAGVTDYIPQRSDGDRFKLLADRIQSAVQDGELPASPRPEQGSFEVLARLASDAFWIWEIEADVMRLDGFEKLFGYEVREVDFEWCANRVHPEDREAAVTNLKSTIEAGETTYEDEFRWQRADGTFADCWNRARIQYSTGGEAQRVLGTIQDITPRKTRTRELRRERDRFETLFENVPVPVVHGVARDEEPIVKNVNRAFEEVFGYSAATIEGESVDEFIVPDESREKARALNKQALLEGSVRAEVRRETTDGIRDFKVHIVTNQESDPPEGYSIYLDITTQKQRERKLERQNDRLEEFTRVVSHDLRNPLGIALGQLELLDDEIETDRLEPLDAAIHRMDELLEDMLALARQGERVKEPEQVSLQKAVETSWETLETNNADLELQANPIVAADPSRLQELFSNLFRNAIDHSPNHVTLRVGVVDDADGFFVEDDGPGIPKGDREQIFEVGYSTAEAGSGFGLKIVDEIVAAHDWSIRVKESTAGGARFEVIGVTVL